MVGVDPALVLCYRDEYKLALGEQRGDFHVLLANEWLSKAVEAQQPVAVGGEPWYFFGHCTEVTVLLCAPAQWAAILPVLAQSWRTSAWDAVVWLAPTATK